MKFLSSSRIGIISSVIIPEKDLTPARAPTLPCQGKVDKIATLADNNGMKPTSRQLYQQKNQAADKDARAIIARDFSASRMNATKWREVISDLGDLGLRYRLRWVDVPN